MRTRTVKLLGIAAGKGGPNPGAEDGPYELRERGLVRRLAERGLEVEDLGDIPGVFETRYAARHSPNIRHLPNILQVNRHTHACVLGTLRKAPEAFLLVVGGDHSLAIGTLAGLSDACRRLGLIWIDAHADFNTPESSPSGNVHGMSLAVACGYGHRQLRSIADRDPLVDVQDVFLLGPRALDAGERVQLERAQVRWISTEEWRKRGIVETVLDAAAELAGRCDHVHLSFDVDALDAAIVPGTGTPVSDGLLVNEAHEMLAELNRRALIQSAEFVEYNPGLDRNGQTAAVTIDLMLALLT
jgi:arginase